MKQQEAEGGRVLQMPCTEVLTTPTGALPTGGESRVGSQIEDLPEIKVEL